MSDRYERNAQACLAACAKWKAENPGAQLRFRPMAAPAIMSVTAALERWGVAGNSITRKLLTAMDRATPDGGASVLMAEAAIQHVFGIPSALTIPEEN